MLMVMDTMASTGYHHNSMKGRNPASFFVLSTLILSRYLRIIEEYADVILDQLLAHHHTDSVKIFHSSPSSSLPSSPVSVAYLVPGVSPMRSTLASETGANNPGVRLYRYDRLTGIIEDYDQYYLSLSDVVSGGDPVWQISYSMLEYFDLQALSPNFLSQHVEKVRNFLKASTTYESYLNVAWQQQNLL